MYAHPDPEVDVGRNCRRFGSPALETRLPACARLREEVERKRYFGEIQRSYGKEVEQWLNFGVLKPRKRFIGAPTVVIESIWVARGIGEGIGEGGVLEVVDEVLGEVV